MIIISDDGVESSAAGNADGALSSSDFHPALNGIRDVSHEHTHQPVVVLNRKSVVQQKPHRLGGIQ